MTAKRAGAFIVAEVGRIEGKLIHLLKNDLSFIKVEYSLDS